jgi:hypothetical protein
MTIDGRDSLISAGLQELARDDLFHCQHNTVLASDADSCASVLDSLHGVFNLCSPHRQLGSFPRAWENLACRFAYLEIAAIGRKDRVGKVVARTN